MDNQQNNNFENFENSLICGRNSSFILGLQAPAAVPATWPAGHTNDHVHKINLQQQKNRSCTGRPIFHAMIRRHSVLKVSFRNLCLFWLCTAGYWRTRSRDPAYERERVQYIIKTKTTLGKARQLQSCPNRGGMQFTLKKKTRKILFTVRNSYI